MCFVRFQKINSHSFIHSQLQVMQNGTHGTVNYVQKRPTNNMRNPSTTHRYQKETQCNNVGQPKCKYCGRRHVKRECPAYRQTCIKCGRKHIFKSNAVYASTHSISSLRRTSWTWVTIKNYNGSRPTKNSETSSVSYWYRGRMQHTVTEELLYQYVVIRDNIYWLTFNITNDDFAQVLSLKSCM